ncbi:MAG: nitrilase-related carbon-nitrogen hydrolase [Candidatus Krumholzibacteria bacterium]|nr:nitrilase-related carbon-nitrogen hydrolase [Candidatus Krumholzibacteria bacterium]
MKELQIAAIQTHPVFGEVQTNIDTALGMVPSGCDLAVIPELFNTGYQFTSREEALALAENLTGDTPGPTCARLAQFAGDTGTTVVAGLAETCGDQLFNSAVLIRPDGSRGIYRKVHLFLDEKSIFTPGDLGFPVFEACGTTIGLMICFDWIFPEAARSLALAGAEVICHPSNLLLPWCQDAMITRCQENMVVAVTSNRVGTENRTGTALTFSGRSQIVSRLGEKLATLAKDGIGAATAAVEILEKDKLFTPRNDLWGDRRLDMYRDTVDDGD